ncbi:MAG TPA: hypothetical protein DEQ65_01045 [Ruminococcaceae bacterium]|nr:hypothetical protein [Oscillospiraceae bacterium]
MKKLLYILLFLQIIGGVFSFFLLIGSDAFTAVLAGFICILQIALTVSVIRNTEDIEQLSEETAWLRTKLRKLENKDNLYTEPESAVPAAYHGEAARGTWECVKCGTVNKAGTDTCQSCGAAYSAEINPTSNPYAKKKPRVSRFVK